MQKNMVTKVVATMAVVATAAFGVFYSISTNQKASADETIKIAASDDSTIAENEPVATTVGAVVSDTEPVATIMDASSTSEATGNMTRLPGNSSSRYLTHSDGTKFADGEELVLGENFNIVYSQGSVDTLDGNGFSSFEIKVANLAKEGLAEGATVTAPPSIYCNDTKLTVNTDYTLSDDGTTYTFALTSAYLSKNKSATSPLYDGKSTYTVVISMEVSNTLKGDDALPRSSEKSSTGQVTIKFSGGTYADSADIHDPAETSWASSSVIDEGLGTINSTISLPSLSINTFRITSPTDEDKTLAGQQIYDEVKYLLVVRNNIAGTTAQGVEITETDKSGLASLNVLPSSIIVTNSDGEDLTEKATITTNQGTVSVKDLEIEGNKTVKITYTVRAGTEEMKSDKDKLGQLVAKDVDDKFGIREATATATNAYDAAQSKEAFFNLLVPSIKNTQVEQSVEMITTGETAHVKMSFTVGGENNAKLKDPVLSITNPALGTISNVTVNDTLQDEADVYDNIKPGTIDYDDTITLEYDVTAPTKYATSASGANTTVKLDAINLVNAITQSSTLGVTIPKMSNKVECLSTDGEAPSAEDNTATEHPVHVVATIEEIDPNAAATGVRIVITDKAETDEPLSERFTNLEVDHTAYKVSSPDSNTIYIDCGTIAKNGIVTVKYDDVIKKGYEPNGLQNNIQVTLEAMPDAACNLPEKPDGHPEATAHFTVAAPETYVATKVTDPVVAADPDTGIEETPQTINVSDIVTYSTDFYETTKLGKGRDFTLTLDIEDIVIVSGASTSTSADDLKVSALSTYTPAQVGVKFTDTDDIKILDRSKDDADVTDQYTVTLDDDGDTATISGKITTDLNTDDLYIVYKVKAGNNTAKSFEMLAGHEFSVASTLEVSNLEDVAKSTATIQISDAALDVTKEAKDKEIGAGDTEEYTLTIQNDVEDKFTDYSKARNLIISDDLDEATAKFGYRIDEDSIKVELNGKDITKDSDVVVLVNDDDSGFDIKFNGDLSKKQKLVITYDATTTNIAEGSYSQSLLNSVRVVCDNSVPAYATATVEYDGETLPDEPMMESGSINEASAENTAAISSTGDTRLYIIAGVIAVAVIGGAVVIVVRRRNR